MAEKWSVIHNFCKSERGGPAIEFAFVFPFFLIALLGTTVSFDAYRASNMVARAATTTADLTTRVDAVDEDMAQSIFAAGVGVTGQYRDALDLTIVLSSIRSRDVNGGTVVNLEWSISNVDGQEMESADLAGLELPEISDGDTVIVAMVTATYEPIIETDLFPDLELSSIQVRRPRLVQAVELIDG